MLHPPSRRIRASLALLLAALVVLVASGPAAGATFGTPRDSVAVVVDGLAADFDGRSVPARQTIRRGGDAAIELTEDRGIVRLEAPTPGGRPVVVELAGPRGTPLRAGLHADAQWLPFREERRPGIAVQTDAHECGREAGGFEIQELRRGGTGEIIRLRGVFEQTCSPLGHGAWGAIDLGAGTPASGATLAPAHARWPAQDLLTPRSEVPITLTADTRMRIARVEPTGEQAGDFRVEREDCVGRTLAAGGACRAVVRFAPTAAGTRRARLALVGDDGRRTEAVLEGWSYGGRTEFALDGDPGDFITQGRPATVTPATGTIHVTGDRHRLRTQVQTAGVDRYWTLDLSPQWGEVLRGGLASGPVVHPNLRGLPAVMNLAGDHRGCRPSGAFDVDEARWRSGGGAPWVPRTLALRFVQRCDEGQAAARGTLRFREGDTAVPAPWMAKAGEPAPAIGAGAFDEGEAPPEATTLPRFSGVDDAVSIGARGAGGDRHTWRGPTDALQLDSNADGSVTISTDAGRGARLTLTPGDGRELVTGVHVLDGDLYRNGPKIDVGGSCSGDRDGAYEIRDIARAADGTVTRLWATFDARCRSAGGGGTTGEIRLGQRPGETGARLATRIVRWPRDDLGAPRQVMPVTLAAGAQRVDVASVGLGGAHAGDFDVRDDACSGRTLAPGRACEVWVGFAPSVRGLREATATLRDTEGRRYDVALQGSSYGGVTEFRLSGADGDVTITPADGTVYAGPRWGESIDVSATDRRGRAWHVRANPQTGRSLVPGQAYTAVASGNPADGPTFEVSGETTDCPPAPGTFRFPVLRRAADTSIASLTLEAEQRCAGRAPDRVSVRYRDGDDVVDPPWLRASGTPSPLPVPPGTSSGAGTGGAGTTPPASEPPAPTGPPSAPATSASTAAGQSDARPAPQVDRPGASTAAVAGAPAASARTSPGVVFRGVRDGGRTLRFSVTLPGAGSATLTPWIRVGGRTVHLGRRTTTANRAGVRTVSVTVPRTARGAVRRAGRAVRLSTRLTWRARGAAATTSRTVVPLRGR